MLSAILYKKKYIYNKSNKNNMKKANNKQTKGNYNKNQNDTFPICFIEKISSNLKCKIKKK